MRVIKYIKEKGIVRALEVLYKYKLELFLEKIILPFVKKKPLKDIIMIESHNDFDCNGGAFYNYLIRNGYNRNYKIVWLLRYRMTQKLPENVDYVPLYGPSLKKAKYICTAKYFLFDCENVTKPRPNQIMVYCSHGGGGLKNVKGLITIKDCVDYALVQSMSYAPIQARQWSMDWPNERIVSIGYPSHDILFNPEECGKELSKIIKRKFKKMILWMPTFRKGGGYKRNDSTKEQKFGIPLIDSIKQYEILNECLSKKNMLMVLKIHPKQDLSNLSITNMSNIIILTGKNVKKLGIDNYRLMLDADALISDYSGVAYEYLQLNRPIAYVLDDMHEYKRGFVVDDIFTLIAGKEIYNLSDMESFIEDVAEDKDLYKEKRGKIRDFIYQYHDGNSSERLAKLLGLIEAN